MHLLRVGSVYPCSVVRRVNRFVVEAYVGGSLERVYNTNTGRLEDVLVPGARAFCAESTSGRLRYRLVAVEYGGGYAVIDTRLQEEAFTVAVEVGAIGWLRGCRVARRRPRLARSVLDYLLECSDGEVLVELKSAVLRSPWGEALYPDCPTERGRRHLEELAWAARRGMRVAVVFVAGFPGARIVRPNPAGDPELPGKLLEALREGVEAHGIGLEYDPLTSSILLYNDNMPVVP
ncbi:sugar fermentation stimulation protein [Pyrolobus fumarii 1A]|uniref:Sugar fermentation stimulation protein n=1 Tax=Pyrolobus fumarii (strain DSM 11204 / 1A) TaxID=694429 RepID=G0EH14_PYRF1|nr:DNA/RNA nuclease SfsA [Pyrolobus fumarii]AEM38464.1 sugar fermentation stimulation protein [Pyrolobus fumarii 1A]